MSSIETFSLVKERCLLGNLNIRTEMHGDEREPACDLSFSFSSANNLLSKLHPDLRATFYRADDTRDLVTPDNMPHLRFPLLGAQSYELEIPRTRLRVHDAEDPTHDVILGGGKTNKFKLIMKNGGTVEWSFRCQFSKPDEESISKLMRVLNQVVPISLECADEEPALDNFEQVEGLSTTGAGPSEARQAAELLFSAPPDMSIANGLDTPPDDPDFKEVEPAGLTVIERPGGDDDDVVDAEFTPPPEVVKPLPVKGKRSTRKAAVEIE